MEVLLRLKKDNSKLYNFLRKLFKLPTSVIYMLKYKNARTRGKFSLMRFFQKFKPGDSVAVVRELSVVFGYPKKLQGRTGKIIEKQGSAYCVEIKDFNKIKRYLIKPIHLIKIEEK